MKVQNYTSSSLWITGASRTGKTSRLIQEFRQWVSQQLQQTNQHLSLEEKTYQPLKLPAQEKLATMMLVFAANNTKRRELADLLAVAIEETYPINCKTFVGFITDEVVLFWPLIVQQLDLKAQFPLRLRPETEQELATRLWRNEPDWDILTQANTEYWLVRKTLDLLQLAASSSTPIEELSIILEQGLLTQELGIGNQITGDSKLWQRMGELLLKWRHWCLTRGLLSYGLIYDLYWRYLLPNPTYQYHLTHRYQGIFADDVDDYPAIARDLFEFCLDRNVFAVFTYNQDGKVRLGLNADPNYLESLAAQCRIEELASPVTPSLGIELANRAIAIISPTPIFVNLSDSVQSLSTISRAELLRQTAAMIVKAVKRGEVKPAEIAIIAPGLDEIARYSLIEILSASGIPIEPLNEQRPLISSPLIRALLTLLALVYPGLGRSVNRDQVAEMLTVLSQKPVAKKLVPDIDPVRAGLLADYCYQTDLKQPHLLPVESFTRWDRLGHKATSAYIAIAQWIEQQKSPSQQKFLLNPTIVLDRAINYFLGNGNHLPYATFVIIRELIETAQHFWEVQRRLEQHESDLSTVATTVDQFIQLLRRGTITANPRPFKNFPTSTGAVILATIFQYRSWRSSHRWQFWLDATSPLWDQGGAATLFAAPLFLKEWSGRLWTPEDEYEMNQRRLERILRDLFARATEKIFLCHSDLGINGTEQSGSLLPLVHASRQNLDLETTNNLKA